MKLKLIFYALAFLLTLISCNSYRSKTAIQNRAFREQNHAILQEISGMISKDQSIRDLMLYGTTDTAYIDSLGMAYSRRGLDLDSILLINPIYLVSQSHHDQIEKEILIQNEKHTKD